VKQKPNDFHLLAPPMFPFRNGCGSSVNMPGNIEGCHSNATGLKRFKSGTISAKIYGSETRGLAEGLICTRLIVLN
jgi:hypothetical protein